MLRLLLCLLVLVSVATSENEELNLPLFRSLQRHLTVRPVAAHTDQLTLTIGMDVVDVDINEATNTATVGGWLFLNWHNNRLAWTGSSVEKTRVSPDDMWTPDILPYNVRHPTVGGWLHPTLSIVNRSGQVFYVPPINAEVRCQRKQTADQDRFICPIQLGSWTYSSDELDLHLRNNTVSTTYFIPNGRWEVESASATRQENPYECCAETYITMNVELVMKPQHG